MSEASQLIRDTRQSEGRFWSKVEKTDGCWLWQGHRTPDGYGRVALNRRLHQVHRVAYEWLVGPIPDGLQLDHLCRVRNCVNPEHLEAVTRGENIARSMAPVAQSVRSFATGVCLRGHDITQPGALIFNSGHRQCAECWRMADKAYKEANREAINARRAARRRAASAAQRRGHV